MFDVIGDEIVYDHRTVATLRDAVDLDTMNEKIAEAEADEFDKGYEAGFEAGFEDGAAGK